MRATIAATQAYHDKYPDLYSTILGRTGLRVSGLGFGAYRVSIGVEGHRMALRKALTSGINLIDTSANYTDGGSEELIGATLAELISDGLVAREEIVVVTKGGYIQGSNYAMVRERLEGGSGFPDVVEYGKGLWHCIAPEFLQDQITRSLNRLRLRSIDVYLLHNPEYYLSWAAKQGMPTEEARAEYQRRIKDAFAYLETEVESGRIGCYGVSSNSFVHDESDADFTSLFDAIRIADGISLVNHFSVIQFPANLYENGFVRRVNQPEGRTLIGLARDRDLGVLINRPLNAIVEGNLYRLADFPLADVEVSDAEIDERIDQLAASESAFLRTSLASYDDDPQGRKALEQFLSVGATMREHWHEFGTIEHFNDVLSQHFAPRFGFVAQYLRERGVPGHLEWYERYLHDSRALLHAVSARYSREAQERSNHLRKQVGAAVGTEPEGSLSGLAARLLLAVDGVDCVLMGMRREEYVVDAIEAMRMGPLGGEGTWEALEVGGEG